MLLLASLCLGVATVLIHLVWREGQRAEYLADHLSAQVAGTKGALGLLEKLALRSAFVDVVRGATLNRADQPMLARFREGAPASLQELRDQGEPEGRQRDFRLDSTHPPTPYRMAYLRAQPPEQPRIVLTPAESDQLDGELAVVAPRIERELMDLYRASLYR
jgi:Zn-dependent protease with chaperone function